MRACPTPEARQVDRRRRQLTHLGRNLWPLRRPVPTPNL